MNITRWIQAAVVGLCLVAALAIAESVQRPGGQRPSQPPRPQPQGQPPSAPARGGPPVSRDGPPPSDRATPPPDRATPPRGQRGTRPRQGERPRPEPGIGRWSRPHAPDAPTYQRVYPVPGIHDHPTPRAFIPYRHYPRPYYQFRPQFWLGFGLYVGYPLPYPLMFGYPGYVFDGGEIVLLPSVPPAALYGGISFDVTPDDAIVFVDGVEVGMSCDYAPTEQPLTLRPGRHRIEMHAPGMLPLAFDVVITGGQVVPFSGTLQPR